MRTILTATLALALAAGAAHAQNFDDPEVFATQREQLKATPEGPEGEPWRQHIGGDLRPLGRHVDILELEDDRSVGIANFRIGSTKRHPFEWRFSCLRIPTLKAHRRSPVP